MNSQLLSPVLSPTLSDFYEFHVNTQNYDAEFFSSDLPLSPAPSRIYHSVTPHSDLRSFVSVSQPANSANNAPNSAYPVPNVRMVPPQDDRPGEFFKRFFKPPIEANPYLDTIYSRSWFARLDNPSEDEKARIIAAPTLNNPRIKYQIVAFDSQRLYCLVTYAREQIGRSVRALFTQRCFLKKAKHDQYEAMMLCKQYPDYRSYGEE